MQNHEKKKIGLILSGGGARAAYQVGVLRAIANILPKMSPNPFDIICGTSAGAINAVSVATHAQNFRTGVRILEYVWRNLSSAQIYRIDKLGLLGNASSWVFSFLANRKKDTPVSLLNNEPLGELLHKIIKFNKIQQNIDSGYLDAVSVTASGYSSGESVSFFQARQGIEGWKGHHQVGIRTSIVPNHLLASTAIPTIFPAVKINREFFCDGSVRQLMPSSPALHLGAEKILAVGVSANKTTRPSRVEKDVELPHPSLTQIIGHILNSAFVDTLESDLDNLVQINELLIHVPDKIIRAEDFKFKKIELLEISPSIDLNKVASEHFNELPGALKLFIKDTGSSAMLSLLLFESEYCNELMELGFMDAVAKENEIEEFFDIT